jgi:nucleotide-binding universal stress UspA family protein
MKILVCVDGSDLALDAVRHALRLQQEGLDAAFLLATVQEPTYMYEMVLAPDADVLERLSGAVGSRALAGAEALFNTAGVPFKREIGSGSAAATLVEMAERHDCDAIILGARGLGAVRSALLGSVSQGVLHASMLPVTIVKHPGERLPAPESPGASASPAG